MFDHFLKIQDDFFEAAPQLKTEFDSAFQNPLETRSERFCWDYWYVKNQYKLIRTPAEHFFSEELFIKLQNQLIQWGQKNLGCQSVSPMWLSYYIDGCEQKAHTDSPHGPWAFVFSLTDWKNKKFDGGETFLFKPETLCYWDFFDLNKGAEKPQLIENIEPQFNRLTVFDPRFPHGVEKVFGAHEPSDSRIVIHGWFTEPVPLFTGFKNDESQAQAELNEQLQELNKELTHQGQFHGLLSFKLNVSKSGSLTHQEVLCNTLIEIDSPHSDEKLIQFITEKTSSWTFKSNTNSYQITIPFLFK